MNFTEAIKKYHSKGKTIEEIVPILLKRGVKTKAGADPSVKTVKSVYYALNSRLRDSGIKTSPIVKRKYKAYKSKIFDQDKELAMIPDPQNTPIEMAWTNTKAAKVAIVFTTRENVAEVIRSYLGEAA